MKRLLLILAIFAGPEASRSAGLSTSTAHFLRIPPGLRIAAMGEAFVALADDASTTTWNPAGLSGMDRPELQLLYHRHVADIHFSSLSAALPAGRLGTLGFNALTRWVPPFDSTGGASALQGRASSFALGLGWGRRLGSRTSVGLSGRYVQSGILDSRARGAGAGFGLLYSLWPRRLVAGLAYDNLVSALGRFQGAQASEKLPQVFRAGLAWQTLSQGRQSLISTLEYSKPLDSAHWLGLGVEWSWSRAFSLRAGYKIRGEGSPFSGVGNTDLGGLSGASFGAGLRNRWGGLDYAYVPLGVLGQTHRIGLTLSPQKEAPPSPAVLVEEVPVIQDLDMRADALGSTTFSTRALTGLVKSKISGWSVEIADPRGLVVRRLQGEGDPPTDLEWDGRDDLGNPVDGGSQGSYLIRLHLKDGLEVQSAGALSQSGIITAASPEPETPVSDQRLTYPGEVLGAGRGQTLMVQIVSFETESDVIEAEYLPLLDLIAEVQGSNPTARIHVTGYTDLDGSAATNLRLSYDRAEAVVKHLVKRKDVPPASLVIRSFGASFSRGENTTEEGRAENRRAEIVVVLPDAEKLPLEPVSTPLN